MPPDDQPLSDQPLDFQPPAPHQDLPPSFAVLGPLRLLDASAEPVEVTAEKQQRLLTALLLSVNEWVPVDRLIEEIWPDGAPASARGNVKTYVHQTRQLLPAGGDSPRIESRRGSYRLNARADEVDVQLFEEAVRQATESLDDDPETAGQAASAALELWRGEPYERLSGERAQAERARLAELRWVARYRAAEAMLATGDADEAVAFLRPLTVEEPLREGTWVRLMRALRAAGRLAEALEAYRDVRRILVAEIGAEPGAGLREQQRLALAEQRAADDESTPAPVGSAGSAGSAGPIGSAGSAGSKADSTKESAETPSGDDVRQPWWRRIPVARWVARPSRRPVAWTAGAVALVVLAGGLYYGISAGNTSDEPAAKARKAAEPLRKRPIPGVVPGQASGRLLFGIGEGAVRAGETELAETTPIGMYTTWFDDRDQLAKFAGWKNTVIPAVYQQGKAHHLFVTSWEDPAPLNTKYGPGCGQAYPLSAQYLDDMRKLAEAFAGPADGPPLFVSMFDGPEKLACTVDGYRADPPTTTYFRAIKDRYREVLRIFHETAPNARVGLNWNGWQADGDEPETGGRLSMFPFFDDIMRISDFQSFSAFQEEDNAGDIRAMTKVLGRYGPVMLSYYKPFKNSVGIFDHDTQLTLTEPTLRQLTADGLFAWSFWDDEVLDASPTSYTFVQKAVQRFSRPATG